MKEKPKQRHLADGREFVSQEELHFYFWCADALAAGIVSAWSYQPRTFELAPKVTVPETVQMKTKTKTVEHFLLNPCSYTPDFLLVPGPRWHLVAKSLYSADGKGFWIDVKGKFGGQYGDDVKFSLLQKWLYDKWRIYVNKVIPVNFFEKTFVPGRAAIGKSGRERTCYLNCRTLPQLLNSGQGLF